MTLDCVGLAQFSVMQIIYRKVGLKCFFHLPKFLLLSFFLTFIFHHVV